MRFRLVPAGDASDARVASGQGALASHSMTAVLSAARPVVDELERAVARARAESALFGEGPALPRIGRYCVVERAGAGGMGVVWAAYDPELNRAVAIKLVRAEGASARDRVLAEGQALASLSHPNVVPVFDVGLHADQVFLVMELVRGETLRDHVAARPRDPSAIAQIYRQAGEGLAAAHRAGLIHRDFKPDNAIIGVDGRVRVLDFGLARQADPVDPPPASPPAAGSPAPARPLDGDRPPAAPRPPDPAHPVIGTPRYMAPEQAAGGAITAAADQYAFCVSLREALTAPRPGEGARPAVVPRWLEAIIARGTQPDPAARFPSMGEVTRALAREPRVILRNRLLVVGAAALVGAAFAIGRAASRPEGAATCDGGRPAIDEVWGPGQRGPVVDRLAAELDPYARESAPRVAAALDSYRDRWADGHREACLAHRRGEQSALLLDRRMACLHRARTALTATVEVLAAARGGALPGALVALGELPDLGHCGDPEALLTRVEPPPPPVADRVAAIDRDLERAQVLLVAARPEARDLAVAAVAEARSLGYPPVLARALLVVGRIAIQTKQRAQALAPLDEATSLALSAGDDALAVEAFARRAWAEATGTDPDFAHAVAGLPLIEALSSRLGPTGRFARALLHNNLGGIELSRGRRAEARTALQRAVREARGVTGAGSLELAKVPAHLALVLDDPARRSALFGEVIGELTSALGHDHPMTLEVRMMAGVLAPDPRDARRMLEPACRAYARLHPTYSRDVAGCWFELGFLALDEPDPALLAEAMDRVVATASTGGNPRLVDLARAHASLARGDPAAAIAGFSAVLRGVGPPAGQPWWVVSVIADAELGAGLAQGAAGAARASERALDRAREHLEWIASSQPVTRIQRRLAHVRAAIARLRAARRAPGPRIAPLARAAADWYRAAGGHADRVDELAALGGDQR